VLSPTGIGGGVGRRPAQSRHLLAGGNMRSPLPANAFAVWKKIANLQREGIAGRSGPQRQSQELFGLRLLIHQFELARRHNEFSIADT